MQVYEWLLSVEEKKIKNIQKCNMNSMRLMMLHGNKSKLRYWGQKRQEPGNIGAHQKYLEILEYSNK